MDSKIINLLLKSLISKATNSENSKLSMEPDIEVKKVSLDPLPEDEEDDEVFFDLDDAEDDGEDKISMLMKLFKV